MGLLPFVKIPCLCGIVAWKKILWKIGRSPCKCCLYLCKRKNKRFNGFVTCSLNTSFFETVDLSRDF